MAREVLRVLGEAVKQIRHERGMTQQQLADLAELHRTFVVAIERGQQNASTLTILRIAAALGVLPAELFRGFTKKVMNTIAG